MDNNFMSYVNRTHLADVNNQVLSTFDWDVQFSFGTLYAPYYPPESVIKSRLKNVSGIVFNKNHQPASFDIRGNHLLFPGWTDNKGGVLNFNFVDYSDLSITTWINDWTKKCNDWKTHQSFPKSTLVIDVTFYQLDTFRNPVFQWNFKTGIINGGSTEPTGAGDKQILNDNVTLPIEFEYVEPISLTARA